MTDPSTSLAEEFLSSCRVQGLRVATAESCTGGGIIARLTDIPGSSDVVDRGFVTYSNEAKTEMLGVQPETIAHYGAVSSETAIAMASGALQRSRAGIALSVTGIAGPGGGSSEKPVGLVWFGVAVAGRPPVAHSVIFDDKRREFIRACTVEHALESGLDALRALQAPLVP